MSLPPTNGLEAPCDNCLNLPFGVSIFPDADSLTRPDRSSSFSKGPMAWGGTWKFTLLLESGVGEGRGGYFRKEGVRQTLITLILTSRKASSLLAFQPPHTTPLSHASLSRLLGRPWEHVQIRVVGFVVHIRAGEADKETSPLPTFRPPWARSLGSLGAFLI